jgi:hypothetical protein
VINLEHPMGAAAENRYRAMVRRDLDEQAAERQQREDMRRAMEVAAECDEFARLAMEYIAAPRGMRQPTVESRKQQRGWAKRNDALQLANAAWAAADPEQVMAYHAASVKRAQAAHALLVYVLADWTIPDFIKVPRAAR